MFEELYSPGQVRPESMLYLLMHFEADMVNFYFCRVNFEADMVNSDFCKVSFEAGMVNLRNGMVS